MALPVLTPSQVFGTNSHVYNNLSYLDEQTIIYPAGSQIIFYEVDQKIQRFLPIEDPEGMSTMLLHPSGKFLLVAIRGSPKHSKENNNGNLEDKCAVIYLYDINTMKKKKMYHANHDGFIKEFISLSFTKDGKNMVALSSSPDSTMYIWNIEKAKAAGSLKVAHSANAVWNRLSCNPFDNNPQICLIGDGLMRLYKYSDGLFKILHQIKSDKNLLCHTWTKTNRIVVGTQDSKLLVFDSGELILEISYVLPPSSNAVDVTPNITCVIPYSNGLIAGISTGVVVIFEKTDDSYLYKKNREYLLEESEINTLAINFTETLALATLNNGQIYSLPIDLDPSKGDVMRAEKYVNSTHFGPILGMDVATHKPLVVTSGADKSIRVWNYLDNRLEVVKYFSEEAQSISVHPSGFYILAAFTRSLKLLTLLIDDIRPYWETHIPGCRECQFSKGGQYFAVVLGATIQIYKTWTFAIAGGCRENDVKIKAISWSNDDSHLISSAMDGSITIWNMETFKKEQTIHFDLFPMSSPIFTLNTKTAYALSTDGIIKEITDNKITKELHTKIKMTQLVAGGNSDIMFAAASNGDVRSIKFPFTDYSSGSAVESLQYVSHSSEITRMKISCDDQFLFTSGEDGLLWIWKINDVKNRKNDREWTFSDEILVTKSDLRDNFKQMTELKQRVEEMKCNNDSHQKLKDQAYSKKLNDTIEKFRSEVQQLKLVASNLNSEREQSFLDHSMKLKEMRESHEFKLSDMKVTFEDKMKLEATKYLNLIEKGKSINELGKAQQKDLISMHDSRVQEIAENYKVFLQEKDDDIKRIKIDIDNQLEEFLITTKDIEDDIEKEYISIQYQYSLKLKKENDIFKQIQLENQKMKNEYDALAKLVEESKLGLNKMFSEEKRVQIIIKELEKDIQGLRHEIQERNDTLLDKDKRIFDLRKKNQELEKFKFVLDFKIIELKKQIEPKETQIVNLNKNIKEMTEELEKYMTNEGKLSFAYSQLQLKSNAAKIEKESEIQKRNYVKQLIQNIKNDVIYVYNLIANINELKTALTIIQTKYLNQNLDSCLFISTKYDDKVTKTKSLKNKVTERESSRGALEKTVEMTRVQMEKTEKGQDQERIRYMVEASVLVTELNYLKTQYAKITFKLRKNGAIGERANIEDDDQQDVVKLHGNVSPAEFLINEVPLPMIQKNKMVKK